MTLNDVIKQQQIVMPKVEELCSTPIATSKEEVASWQSDHMLFLLQKEKKVKELPEQLYDEVDNMFAGSQDFYAHMVTGWFDNNFANVRRAQLRLEEKNGDISREQRVEAFEKIKSTDVSKIDNTEKMRLFFDFFETLLVKIQNRGDWLGLLRGSSLGILSDRLVCNIGALDLFVWQLPNADSRHFNNYHQVAKIMVIFFCIEKIYKNDYRLSDDVDPFEKLFDLKKIISYYKFPIPEERYKYCKFLIPEETYKYYRLKGLLTSKEKYLAEHPNPKDKRTIAKKFKEQFNISDAKYDCFEDKHSEDIQNIKSKYTEERDEGFKSILAFYDWYEKQPQECGYCRISQVELYKLFPRKEGKKLPLNDAIKRSSGTLEIERRDSNTNIYDQSNSILACPLCNNAKSNLIDEDSWESLFVRPMREYYKNLLGRDLKNPCP